MRYSFSRVDCFKTCPYQFKLRYIDKIKTLPDWNDAANPLIIGSALHHGIEKGVDEAIEEYFNGFPVITDKHIEEAMKLRALIPKVKALIKDTAEFEVVIEDKGRFIGYIDYLDVENSIILDFKYTTKKNFEEKYLKSPQVHIYKWYLKELTGVDIQKIGYIHVPKISIRQKKTEDLIAFRKRLTEELEKAEPSIGWVRYSDEKVDEFLTLMEKIDTVKEFPKNQTKLCDWCDYQEFCEKGEIHMFELPSTARRTSHDETIYKKIWVYGSPFSGKTTFADNFPKPLMLNTDGNVKFVTAPFMSMKNTSIWDGRVEHKYMAWEVFKETIKKLKEDADKGKADRFQSIVIDLAEHLKESCRLYMFEQMGIKHESDDPFRSYDKIRTEYCSTMRELLSLPYNMIIISHEDTTRDIMKRGGDKITSIRPNIDEKTANYLAGLVDIVGRCVVVDGEYRISFKSDEVVFGGGRIPLNVKEIPNDYKTFMKVVYNEDIDAIKREPELPLFEEPAPEPVYAPAVEEKVEEPLTVNDVPEEIPEELPVRRTRRVRSTN